MIRLIKTLFQKSKTNKQITHYHNNRHSPKEKDRIWYLKRTIIYSYISIIFSLIAIAITIMKKLL